jgi:hypothetical protein
MMLGENERVVDVAKLAERDDEARGSRTSLAPDETVAGDDADVSPASDGTVEPTRTEDDESDE